MLEASAAEAGHGLVVVVVVGRLEDGGGCAVAGHRAGGGAVELTLVLAALGTPVLEPDL